MIPSRLWALAALVALAVVPWVLARHQLSLLTDLLIAGLFAMSLDLIMGYTGMVSFGHAAYFGLGAYASALVLLHFAQPVPIALLAGALLAGAVAVPVGCALQAIRENERRFTSLGRDPRPFKLVVFVIAAVFAGLAGALFAPFRGFASPEVMFWVFSGQGLMMVIMGGIGTLVGPVLGAMLFILIQEVLSSYTEHWMIFTGVVFVLIVIFLPGGLVGTARRLGTRG